MRFDVNCDMRILLSILIINIVFCDTIYLKNNQFIEDVEYLGYFNESLIFKTDNSRKLYYILLSKSEKIIDQLQHHICF